MKLAKLKSDAIDSEIMAQAHKEIWLEYEEEAKAIRQEVTQQEVRKGICKVLVCVLLLVLAGGCCAVHGALKDGAWLLDKAAENTEVQDK